MKGKDFIEKINRADRQIALFSTTSKLHDGGLNALTPVAEAEILEMLKEYKEMLLENEVR